MKSFCTLICGLVLLVSFPATSEPLTKAELFDLYAHTVDLDTIGGRMNSLFSTLPAGAFKDTVKATLKQDLLDALTAQIGAANTEIEHLNAEQISAVSKAGAAAAELAVLIAEQQDAVIPPIEELQTDVGDTDL